MSTHLLGPDVNRSTLTEDIGRQQFPACPPAARLAVMVGQPAEPASYVVRVRLPAGTAHFHWARSDGLVSP